MEKIEWKGDLDLSLKSKKVQKLFINWILHPPANINYNSTLKLTFSVSSVPVRPPWCPPCSMRVPRPRRSSRGSGSPSAPPTR